MRKKIAVLLMSLIATGCVSSAKKSAKWINFAENEKLVCRLDGKSSSDYIADIQKKNYTTNKAPSSRMFLEVERIEENKILVKKMMRRYTPSISSYSTLSAIEILIDFTSDNKYLYLNPVSRKEYQNSVVGKWEIPKLTTTELLRYLGHGCVIS